MKSIIFICHYSTSTQIIIGQGRPFYGGGNDARCVIKI